MAVPTSAHPSDEGQGLPHVVDREVPRRSFAGARPARGGDEAALMERVRRGDEASYAILLERYWPPLVGYAERIVASRDDARDVVQEVFIRLWEHRSRWAERGTVAGYLYRITRNLSLNASRDRSSRRAKWDLAARDRPSETSMNPVRELHSQAIGRAVSAALDSLPERRREVFVLSRFHGLSHGEIAEAMGISVQTVANQTSAALRELRSALAHLLAES